MVSLLTLLFRKATTLFGAFAFCIFPLIGADQDSIKSRVRELHANAAGLQIKLADGTKLSGKVVRIADETFTIAQEKTGNERTLPYSQVTEVKKKGLSRSTKAILIPAAIGGGALLVLCAGPYPIGFLCRKDPS